jgi:signal peptidase I
MPASTSILREYLEALLIAVIFATFARTYAVQAFKIPTGSMEENLLIGDHILVNKFVFGPKTTFLGRHLLPVQPVRRGDVVVFKFPEDPKRDFIKRCIGLPGDRVEIIDKVIYVNGEMVDDAGYTYHSDPRVYPRSVFLPESYRNRDNFGPTVVPDGHYFFLGDNRDNSNDSRFWGPVPADFIKGRAFLIYWSFDSGSKSTDRTGYQGKLSQLATVVLRFFTQTRWERSFRIVR